MVYLRLWYILFDKIGGTKTADNCDIIAESEV